MIHPSQPLSSLPISCYYNSAQWANYLFFFLQLKSFDGTIISQVTSVATTIRQREPEKSAVRNPSLASSEASTIKPRERHHHHHQIPYQQQSHSGSATHHPTTSAEQYQSSAASSDSPGAYSTQSRTSPRSVASNPTILCKVSVQNIGWGTQVSFLLDNKIYISFENSAWWLPLFP